MEQLQLIEMPKEDVAENFHYYHCGFGVIARNAWMYISFDVEDNLSVSGWSDEG